MNQLFDHQTEESGPVECFGQTFPSDEARREHFLKLLAEKLKDPNFRKQEGFPEATDEAILEISDPPYYTACPNPWLENAADLFKTPSDLPVHYFREPFASDVVEGKNHPLYNAHTYHTKVPHRAIMRFILHYTKPGDIVLDGFSGTGMTGIASAACGSRSELQEMGFNLKGSKAFDKTGQEYSLGARYALLNDLSPIATFIASNLNDLPRPEDLLNASTKVLNNLKSVEQELYSTFDENGSVKGRINYVVWSDAYICQECSSEYIYWNEAVVLGSGEAKKIFPCPHCGANQNTRNLTRAYTQTYDPILDKPVKMMKQVPSHVNYFDNQGKKARSKVSKSDYSLATKPQSFEHLLQWTKAVELPRGDRYRRDAFADKGVTHAHHFYTWRNLKAIYSILDAIQSENFDYKIKRALYFVVTSFADRNGTKRNRFVINKYNPNGRINGPMANTLYLPNLFCEMNIFELFREKLKDIISACSSDLPEKRSFIGTSSASKLCIKDNSIDYIFTDPPFGHNIQYSELNLTLESILGVLSSPKEDIVVNEAADKDLDFYREGMRRSFSEYYRVLKPGHWITVEFSNTQAAIWNSIQTALSESGFVIASVAALDKTRGGMHSTLGVTAVKQDLAITAYKPDGELEKRFSANGPTQESVWDFVQSHMQNLPVIKVSDGQLDYLAERDPRILFDRVVAWFVRHNAPVPVSSQEFQEGMRVRFPERDGMYFLPDQVAEYDRKRAQSAQAPQLEMFVSDERSAIDWLTDFLKRRPSTYQETHPDFTTQIGAGWKKHEAKPELKALLEDNFLKYDGNGDVPSQIHSYLSTNHKDLRGLEKDDPRLIAKAKDRWYVPDPNKAHDIEKKREKALLKEFQSYLEFTGRRLKEFRLEVLRAGFKDAYSKKDYQTIVSIAKKIPDESLQSDEKLLLWYDQALTRTEENF